MDKARKVQNILIVITAIIIAIFIAQVTFNILDNKGASLMQIPNDRLKNNNNVNYHYPTTAAVQQQGEQSTAIKSSPTKNIVLPAESSSSLTSIFKQVESSVVQIASKVSNSNDIQIIINGKPLRNHFTKIGSGFVYDNQGHIVINNHVVDSAKTIDVTFVDGNTYSAKVVGTDPSSDIAVLQIVYNFSTENVVLLVVANSSRLQTTTGITAL